MIGLLCVTAGKGSPGATTLALTLARHLAMKEETVLVDADPDGGDLAALLGLSVSPGLVSLAAAGRHHFSPDELPFHLQSTFPALDVLAAPSSPEQATSSLRSLGTPFAETLVASNSVADVGRWRPGSDARDLVHEAQTTLLVIHPTLVGVSHARFMLEDLSRLCHHVVVVCRGNRPYDTEAVASALGCDSVFAIPVDRAGAAMASSGTSERWVQRSPLGRAVCALLDALTPVEVAS